MIINDDVEGLKRKIEQLETELKCVEDLNRKQFETIVDLNIENVQLNERIISMQNALIFEHQDKIN